MADRSSISTDVLARYAADTAKDVAGVEGLVGRHEGVKVGREGDAVSVELHLSLVWGANAPAVGAEVQDRVVETLSRMAGVRPTSVDVVVAEFAAPAA